MNEALDANAAPHLSEHPSGEEMRSRMTSLVNEIERTTRIGVRLWTLAGLVGCFSLAMGTYNHRPSPCSWRWSASASRRGTSAPA